MAERREKLNRSQAFLAEMVGVRQQTISAIERGGIIPSDKLKLRIAGCLGTTPTDLFAWPSLAEIEVPA